MAKNFCADTDYQLGTSLASMVTLKLLNIPVPDQVIFRPASAYYVRANMSRVGDGYKAASWVWDAISLNKLAIVLSFLGGADFVDLYVKTDLRDGTFRSPAASFKIYSCKMWKPILSGEEGVPIARSPYALQTVQLKFVDLVEQVGYL